MLESVTPARHLKMLVGRVTKHWNRNCLAVGLSQGFIEPLEATALLFIQRTVQGFIDCVERGETDAAGRGRFNRRMNEPFAGRRDYIVTPFKPTSRTDTEYWRANAATSTLSDALVQLLGQWLARRSIAADVG